MTDSDRLTTLENQFAEKNRQLDIQLAELGQQQGINTNSMKCNLKSEEYKWNVSASGSICSLNKEAETLQAECQYLEVY